MWMTELNNQQWTQMWGKWEPDRFKVIPEAYRIYSIDNTLGGFGLGLGLGKEK